MAKLIMVNGDLAGKGYALKDGKDVIIGRQEGCEMRVDYIPGISRKHAVFRQQGSAWMVEDLGSQNGIFFDNVKVEQRTLKDGDVVWFSNLAVRYVATEALTADEDAAKYLAEREQEVTGSLKKAAPEKTVHLDHDDDHEHPTTHWTREAKVATKHGTTAMDRRGVPAPTVEAAAPQPLSPPVVMSAPAPEPAPAPASAPAPLPGPAPTGAPPMELALDLDHVAELGRVKDRIYEEFGKAIVGQRDVLEELLVALLSSGHCLMIGLPGLAKTLMVSTLSQILDLQFKRIQFTPDLMPSDIIGSDVLDMEEGSGRKSFRFIHGPIFTNMLLADEINRTPPKTQAALLEAMQERQVTASNHRFPLPAPFFVLATQNPLEQEGTYPLPEAQLDRFMFNILVGYPSEAEEEQIVMETTRRRSVDVKKVLTGEQLLALQAMVRDLPVSPHVVKYATRLVRATRPADKQAPDYVRQHVSCGAGPRAAQFLVLGAKARAILGGRLNVACDDVRALAMPILRHRIYTNFTADSEGITADDLVKRLLLNVPEPRADEY